MTQDAVNSVANDLAILRSWSQASPSVSSPTVVSVNQIIGDGTNVLSSGIQVANRADFNGLIVGCYIHEFDGITGSIVLGIDKAAYVVGSAPTFASIVGSSPPSISSARYAIDETLTGWTQSIYRGEVLRFSVTSAASFKRLLVTLRVRRLEP